MIGSVLAARYEMVSLLQEGPIFATYLARDKTSGVEVGVRMFKPPFDLEGEFVVAVAAALRKASVVNHPGVERIDGLDHAGQRPFLVGQYSPGITLGERMRKLAPFSVPVSVSTAISILEGLEALHAAGIVHGDVGAENVIIGVDGSARLQLASIWEAYSRSATAGAVVLPAMAPYLAPEVSTGGAPSYRSDVYAVGILLFELLSGRLPYAAETPIALAMRHAQAPTPSIKGYSPSAPLVLDEIIKKAMDKDASLRYPSAGAMLVDLRTLQDALRFGRTLSWPLQGPRAAAGREPAPVAPRMSAARPDPDPRQRGGARRERSVDDLPPWMSTALWVAIAVVVTAIVSVVVLNATRPRMVAVPSLRGKDATEARTLLRSMKLDMREQARQPSGSYPTDTVLSTVPESGDRVREGTVVDVTVSSGSGEIEVPDLTGMELDAARTVLSNLDLNVREPIDRIDSSAPRDQVVGQDPPPKQKVSKEAGIQLKVSDGVPPRPGQTPQERLDTEANAHQYTLKIKVSDVDVPTVVRIDIQDAQGTRTIYSQQRDPGDAFSVDVTGYGPDATFTIYYDDTLERTVHESAEGGPRRRAGARKKPTDERALKPKTDAGAPPATDAGGTGPDTTGGDGGR